MAYAKPHEAMYRLNGLVKVGWMVKSITLYLNTEENGTFLILGVGYFATPKCAG